MACAPSSVVSYQFPTRGSLPFATFQGRIKIMPRTVQYKPNAIVYFSGDRAANVFVLKSGRIQLRRPDIETGLEVREQVSTGEFFGVKSALGAMPHEESAIVTEPSTALVLSLEEFEQYAMQNSAFTIRMLKVFSSQLRRFHRRAQGLMSPENREYDSEEGLYSNALSYAGQGQTERARYIFRRYLEYYPQGRFRAEAENNIGRLGDPPPSSSALFGAPAGRADGAASASGLGAFQRFSIGYKKDDMIFSEYEPGNSFYLIQQGRVQISRIVGGIEKNLDVLQPGEIFGEMAILESAPRSAAAIALDNTTLLEFNRANFEALLHGDPRIALRLLKLLAKRIYDQRRRIVTLLIDDVYVKVADVFLLLDEAARASVSPDPESNERIFQISVEDVAHWAGISSAEARQVLNDFIRRNKIEMTTTQIKVYSIIDMERMVKLHQIA